MNRDNHDKQVLKALQSIAKSLERMSKPDEREEIEHDGCKKCEYENFGSECIPCNVCKNNYRDCYKCRTEGEGD